MESKRLNVNLPLSVYEQLDQLAKASGQTMTEIVRTGLGLATLAYEERNKNHRLAVTNEKGVPIREVVLPK